MERAKQLATLFFKQIGFRVEEIPETDQKRADLAVDDGQQQYIVEVKEKEDTGSQLTVLPNIDGETDLLITSEPHAPSNRMDGVMKVSRKQLASTPAHENALRLIFHLFEGRNADMFVRRTLYTFYGVQDVAASGNGSGLNCVYFHNSFSFASPKVDGLVLMENRDLLLCLNEFSPKCDLLRNSQLSQKMGRAVYDPSNFGNDDGKVVLRSAISRKDEQEVLRELERTTGVRYHTVNLNRYSFG